MKKVGIITFHNALNYGAVLQTFALFSFIQNLGYDCEVIDYCCSAIVDSYAPGSGLKGLVKKVLSGKNTSKTREGFERFLSLMPLSPPCGPENILQMDSRYAALVTGSDQVWNYGLTDFDPSYFLGFAGDKAKKNSYAASFGISEIPEEQKNRYRELLSNFNAISVRETRGAEIISGLLGADVPVHLDPVFLPGAAHWEALIDPDPLVRGKYILIYSFGLTPEIIASAQSLKKKTGARIVRINNGPRNHVGFSNFRGVGPLEFLNLFRHAEYILTNSFHGTAFSLIFKKKFYTQPFYEVYDRNSRLDTLNALLCLDSRILSRENCRTPDETADLNWDTVEKIISGETLKSAEYLKKSLG